MFKCLAVSFLLLAGSADAQTLTAQGTSLTAASANLQVTFSGADVTGIKNLLTGEQYLRNPSTNSQLNLIVQQSTNQPFAPSGSWTVNAAGSSASLILTDSIRTVTALVSIDSATQQIVVTLDGKASSGGVQFLDWGVTGFDMTIGKFITPAQGGVSLTSASFSASNDYRFYGIYWEAPLSLFQTAQGGAAIFSSDKNALFRNLLLNASAQQTVNEQFQIEAPAPWAKATEVGPVEWRLAGYSGEWQAGARLYRDWHNANFPPPPLTPGNTWINKIRTVVEVQDNPYTNSTLDSIAKLLVPSQTLLYLVSWRAQAYDTGYPDYNWIPSTSNFIAYAHQLGFHVMLHANALGVSPSSSDYASVAQYQMRDPYTLQLKGWLWNSPPSTPNRFAMINPAAAAYRQLLVSRLTPAVQNLQPDAIHLDAGACMNDANGPIQGMNCSQGLAQLERDLTAAFPNVAIGMEQTYDTIAPYDNFSQPLAWSPPQDPSVTPPVPVAAYVLNDVHRYAHLGARNPNDGGFLSSNLEPYEAQAVLPTLHTPLPNSTQPDMARYLAAIRALEQYALSPAWDTPWNGAEMVYQGSNGTSAALTDSGTLVQFTLQQSGSSSLLYQRVHGTSQIDSPLSVPNWPAFNGTVTFGLDPSVQYWLDSTPKNTTSPHITSLPAGAKLGLGTGTVVTPQFAYFTVLPPASSAFDFFSNLWLANLGITYQGQDYLLSDGAGVNQTTVTVGGATRTAISCFPPWMTKSGGDVFVEFSVPLPVGPSSFSFAAGIDDLAAGQRQGPMTFKVEINGATFWDQDISTGAWQPGSIDLSAWSGQTVKIRLVANPGPSGPYDAFAGWSNLQLSTPAPSSFDSITVSTPAYVSAANVSLTGGRATAGNGSVTVTSLPFNGTIVILTGTGSTAAPGQTLFSLPYTLSQSSDTQIGGVPVTPSSPYIGNVGPKSSGGVTKQQTLYAPSPANGQSIFSWILQVPTTPLAFSFSAGFWDNVHPPFPQGYLMSVRVNGVTLWSRVVNVPPSWQYGALDLSRWSGQTILLELITDSQGANSDNFTSWSDLAFSATSGAACIASTASTNPISAPASGASGTVPVNIPASCDWSASSQASWISIKQTASNGSGSVLYSIALNIGPARQATLEIAGNTISVTQAAAAPFNGPKIISALTVAGGSQRVAPNTWMILRGNNLSATTRPWQASDFVNGLMPAQLDAVTVAVNGKPAIVQYISENQVNILTPIDVAQGTAQITVTSGGLTSAPIYLPAQAAAPEFFLFSGTQYVAALHSDGTYVGPSTLYPGLSSPAKPGEVVILYAGGFGQTVPPISGLSASQSGSLSPTPAITVGGIGALVQFAGVVSPGLYQFNVVVPQLAPDGDDLVVASYGGLSTQPTVAMPIQH